MTDDNKKPAVVSGGPEVSMNGTNTRIIHERPSDDEVRLGLRLGNLLWLIVNGNLPKGAK